jgi:transcriptional regulator with XRE-family HTH domain
MKSIHTTRQERLCMLLRHARKKAGLTQEELSLRLGKYKTYVSKYESGERRLDTLEFLDVAEVLSVDAASIVKAVLKD